MVRPGRRTPAGRHGHTELVETSLSALASPSQWTVRTRTTVASTVVVTFCLVLAGGALLLVLFRSLETSAQSTADARAAQLVDQLRTDPAADLDRSMLATDSQVGVVQVIDQAGRLVVVSAGGPGAPLSSVTLAPGSRKSLGQVMPDGDNDFWVTAAGVQTPTGPVTVLVGADREPVESVVTTIAALLAVAGPIVVALVAFGTHRLVGAALDPVERIRSRVSSMTSGKLAERIPVPAADDEIARLAVTMNELLDRLEAGQAAQRRFVSDASHELRSPLATITAALELAQSRPELLDRTLIDESLLPEARRMHRLVEDLLLLARPTSSPSCQGGRRRSGRHHVCRGRAGPGNYRSDGVDPDPARPRRRRSPGIGTARPQRGRQCNPPRQRQHSPRVHSLTWLRGDRRRRRRAGHPAR